MMTYLANKMSSNYRPERLCSSKEDGEKALLVGHE